MLRILLKTHLLCMKKIFPHLPPFSKVTFFCCYCEGNKNGDNSFPYFFHPPRGRNIRFFFSLSYTANVNGPQLSVSFKKVFSVALLKSTEAKGEGKRFSTVLLFPSFEFNQFWCTRPPWKIGDDFCRWLWRWGKTPLFREKMCPKHFFLSPANTRWGNVQFHVFYSH